MNTNVWIILAAAVLTYLTRTSGHWLLARFSRLPPRVEAGLNAVPSAVLTTLVAPAALSAGPIELAALLAAGLAALRGGMMTMFIVGAVVLIALRNLFG